MAHYAKYSKAACGHMFKHYERAKDENGEYLKFSNGDIHPEKTPLNYNLGPSRQSQGDFVRQRCGEVRCQNRKDVSVMCSWVVTAPKELLDDELELFFKTSYDFLSERYGTQNVVSAYVHMDETTPHIHFAFVPVVWDNRNKRDKVCAKECVDRRELQTFHGSLSKRMEEAFGRDIGVLNEATRDGNKSIRELEKESRERVRSRCDEIESALTANLSPILDELSANSDVQPPAMKKTLTGQFSVSEGQKKEIEGVYGERNALVKQNLALQGQLHTAAARLSGSALEEERERLREQNKTLSERNKGLAKQNRGLDAGLKEKDEQIRQRDR